MSRALLLSVLFVGYLVIDLGRGNRRIVAAFVAKNLVMGQEEIGIHELFFIARETPQGLLREVSGSYGTFLGAIDLDQDGVAEVIAFGFGYESHSYTIHSLKNGKWEYMYAAEAGC